MLKLDYFWRMLCHTVFSLDSFEVSVWMEKQEANERDLTGLRFPTTSLRAHSHVGGSTYFYPILTNQMGWATKARGDPTSADPALLLGMCVPCFGYMSWPLFVRYCVCYKWWECVSDTGQHWAWVSCALLDLHSCQCWLEPLMIGFGLFVLSSQLKPLQSLPDSEYS